MKTMNERTENAMTSTCALTNDGNTKRAGKGGPSRAFRALAAVAVMMAGGAGAWGADVSVVRDLVVSLKTASAATRDFALLLEFFQGRYQVSLRQLKDPISEYNGYLVAYQDIDAAGNGIEASWKVYRLEQAGEKALGLLGFSYIEPSASVKSYLSARVAAAEGNLPGNVTVSEPGGLKAGSMWAADLNAVSAAVGQPGQADLPLIAGSVKSIDRAILPNVGNVGGSRRFALLARNKASGSIDVVTFVRSEEYFAGEGGKFALLGSGTPYLKKALAAMTLLLEDIPSPEDPHKLYDIDEFKLMAERRYGVSTADPAWGLFPKNADNLKLGANLATVLARTLVQLGDVKDSDKPVFDLARQLGETQRVGWFDALYGGEKNIYLDAYLAYLAWRGRPLYESILKDPGDTQRTGMYGTIGEGEGLELARAAMSYVTWGVEHDLAERGTSEEEKPKDRRGTSTYEQDKARIAAWLGAIGADATASSNYFDAKLLEKLVALPSEYGEGSATVTGALIGATGGTAWYGADTFRIPFAGGKSGDPIPWTRGGIDSPRTFAYKMVEQLKARRELEGSFFDSTRPYPPRRFNIFGWFPIPGEPSPGNYVTFEEFKRKTGGAVSDGGIKYGDAVFKPFLPGGGSIESPLYAGVDALGFLSGSIAMTSFAGRVHGVLPSSKASALDAYYRMSTEATGLVDSTGKPAIALSSPWADTRKRYVYDADDIERMSVVLPDLGSIRPGDLVIRHKPGTGAGAYTQVGIVVWVPSSGKPGPLDDVGDYLSKIVVVSVREGFRQATLGTWGNPAGAFGGFSLDPKSFHARRLVVRTGDEPDKMALYDVLGTKVVERAFRIGGMLEHTRVGGDPAVDRERWIPNTGEFLAFDGITVTLRNATGALVDPNVAFGKDSIIRFTAKDRSFGWTPPAGSAAPGGNIINNTDCKFELALVGTGDAGQVHRIGMLVRDAATGTYSLDASGSAIYAAPAAGNPPSVYGSSYKLGIDELGRLRPYSWNGTGWSLDSNLRLGIRPESAAKARPGDDLELGIVFGNALQSFELLYGDSKDYVAVYDKKLLWRANLYLDEDTDNPDTKTVNEARPDWNDLHPWNAPPAGTTRVRNAVNALVDASVASPWWSEAWGHNEWNREHDGVSDFKGLAEMPLTDGGLNPGNGGQVITIADWARFYNGRDATTIASGTTKGAVAYSFPGQYFEPLYNDNPDTVGVDQPAVARYFRYKADDPATPTDETFNPLNSTEKADGYNQYVGNRGDAGSMDSPFDFNRKLVAQMKLRGTTAPMVPATGWNGYSKAMPAGATEASAKVADFSAAAPTTGSVLLNTATSAFIPGLGLWYYNHGAAYNTNARWELRGSWILEAGTDCIGFATRAASYSGNIYEKWFEQNAGWTEGAGIPNIWTQLNAYSGTRVYPRTSTDQGPDPLTDAKAMSDEIFMRKDIDFKDILDDPAAIAAKTKIGMIVPGDIFYYYKLASGSHIAIVAEVKYENGILNDIRLIESTYGYTDPLFGGYVSRVINFRLLSAFYLYSLSDLPRYSIVRLRRD